MKKAMLVLVFLGFQSVFSQQADIKRTIETFFEGVYARDTLKVKAVTAKELVMHNINEKPSGSTISVETRAAYLKSVMIVPKSVNYEEKILSWNFQIDGNLAQVWTP